MAVTPKTTSAKQPFKAKGPATTLSASEALKAAESAIGSAPAKVLPKKTPVASPAPVSAKPEPVTPVADIAAAPAPLAVAASTTAVDAAPVPETPVLSTVEAAPTPSDPLPIIEGTTMMNDVMETSKKFAEDAKAKLETVYAGLNEKAKAGVEKSTKAIEEISDLAKGNVEALVESGKIAAKGVETLGQDAVDYSRKSFEKATASFKSYSTVKTPTEFFQLHSQLISSSFDDFTKEAAKNSEAFLKLAGEIAQPLTARVSLVTDKVKSLAA
ncbi:phasin family protein [Sphingobium sp. AN558]|uniref:phasin family protein n=1 Tax=Sphingobium sp. AN558 TaxID=3133442 RepID=UPI0030C455A0